MKSEIPNQSGFNIMSGIMFGVIGWVPGAFIFQISLFIPNIEPNNFIAFFVLPIFCAFIGGGLLGNRIRYKHEETMLKPMYVILISILITVIGLCLWILPAYLLLTFRPDDVAAFALIAGTYLGWLTYPPAILSGLSYWYMSKYAYLTSQQ